MTELPIEVVKADNTNLNGNAVMLTARIKVDPTVDGQMGQALQQIRSKNTKDLVYQERYKFDLSNYGVAVSGGPRPVRKGKDNDGPVVAYELDFKFTRAI